MTKKGLLPLQTSVRTGGGAVRPGRISSVSTFDASRLPCVCRAFPSPVPLWICGASNYAIIVLLLASIAFVAFWLSAQYSEARLKFGLDADTLAENAGHMECWFLLGAIKSMGGMESDRDESCPGGKGSTRRSIGETLDTRGENLGNTILSALTCDSDLYSHANLC